MTLVVGCGGSRINIYHNGIPLPNESTMIENPGGIKLTYEFCRIYEQSKESLYPEYLPMEKTAMIPRYKTRSVALNVWVYNPNKTEYTLQKIMEVDGELEKSTIYWGTAESKRFQLQGPLDFEERVSIHAVIYSRDVPLLFTDEARYEMVQ